MKEGIFIFILFSSSLIYFILIICRKIPFPTPDLGQPNLTSTTQNEPQNQSSELEKEGQIEEVVKEEVEEEGNELIVEENITGKGKRRRNQYETREFPPKEYFVGRAISPMKGHTAFLTFAICPEKDQIVTTTNSSNNNHKNHFSIRKK